MSWDSDFSGGGGRPQAGDGTFRAAIWALLAALGVFCYLLMSAPV